MNYPVDLFHGDCAFVIDDVYQYNMDGATNGTWKAAAPISSCTADLFADGVVPDSKAMVYHFNAPLTYQANGSLVVTYYLLSGCVLYYAARGQGLLHDELFTELRTVPAARGRGPLGCCEGEALGSQDVRRYLVRQGRSDARGSGRRRGLWSRDGIVAGGGGEGRIAVRFTHITVRDGVAAVELMPAELIEAAGL